MTQPLFGTLLAAALLAACVQPPAPPPPAAAPPPPGLGAAGAPGAGAAPERVSVGPGGFAPPPPSGVATAAPGAPAVITGFAPPPPPPAPAAGQARAGQPNWFAAHGLFGADDPPDSLAMGSASPDGTFPGFSQPTGPRSQRFIQRLQF